MHASTTHSLGNPSGPSTGASAGSSSSAGASTGTSTGAPTGGQGPPRASTPPGFDYPEPSIDFHEFRARAMKFAYNTPPEQISKFLQELSLANVSHRTYDIVNPIYLHPLILAFENGEEDQWAGRALAKSPFWSWSDKPLWSKVPEVFKAVLKFAWECSSAEDMLFVVYVEANVTDLRHLETSWLLGSKMQSHSQCYVFKITYESDQGGNIVPDITMFIWDYQLTPQLVPNSDKLRYDARSVPIHMTKTIIAWFYWVSQIQCGYDLPTHQERLEFQQRINNNLVSALKQNKIQAVEPPRPWPLFIPMRKPDVIDPLSRRNIAFPAGFETPDNYFTIDSNMVVPANPRRVGYATTHPPTVAYVDPVANLPTYSRVRSSMRIRQPICPPIMQLVSSQLTDAGIKLDRLFASPERVGTIVSSLYKFGRWVSSRFLASSLQNQYLLHQLYDHGAIWDPVDGRPIGIFPERHRTNMLRLSALNLATPMRVRVVNALTKAWNVLPWSVIKLKEVEPWEAPRDEIFARPFTFHAFWRSPQSANTASECRTETFNFIMDLMEDQDRLMLLNLGGGEAISPQDWIPIVHKGKLPVPDEIGQFGPQPRFCPPLPKIYPFPATLPRKNRAEWVME